MEPEAREQFGTLPDETLFTDPLMQRVWRAVSARLAEGELVSLASVATDLPMDARDRVAELVALRQPPTALRKLVGELQSLAARREAAAILDRAQSALRDGAAAPALMMQIEGDLHAAAARGPVQTVAARPYIRALTDALTHAESEMRGGAGGVSTGLASLDAMIGRLRPGQMIVLAGATSMGKSALATHIAYSIASDGAAVGFASLEMPDEDLATRIAGARAKVPYFALRQGRATAEQLRQVATVAKGDRDLPLVIYDPSVRTIGAIIAQSQRVARRCEQSRRPFGAIVIDYLQLVEGTGESRYQEVSRISTQIKGAAKTMGVPIIALAQVNRAVASRENKKPTLTDLKESGQIENDADVVMFCYREEYYLGRIEAKDYDPHVYRGSGGKVPAEQVADFEAKKAEVAGKMEIIVAKQRGGQIGTVTVGCDMATNRFWDLDQQRLPAA